MPASNKCWVHQAKFEINIGGVKLTKYSICRSRRDEVFVRSGYVSLPDIFGNVEIVIMTVKMSVLLIKEMNIQ